MLFFNSKEYYDDHASHGERLISNDLDLTFTESVDRFKSKLNFDDVVSVQASEYELDFIKEHISGIRMSDCRVVIWEGEEARFIIKNLRLLLQNS